MAFYVFVGTGRDLSLPDKSIYNILKKNHTICWFTVHFIVLNKIEIS
jgi:hypothetical protein